MSEKDLISGYGSGKGGRSPENAEDSLNSEAIGAVLDLISEGEIQGFATPFEQSLTAGTPEFKCNEFKDIFFNKTPLVKPTGSIQHALFDSGANVDLGDNSIQTQTLNINFNVNDIVRFDIINSSTGNAGTGTLPAGLSANTDYFIVEYDNSTKRMKLSLERGGEVVDITDKGTLSSPNFFRVKHQIPTATDFNFDNNGFTIETRTGTDSQVAISGFEKNRSVVSAFPSDVLDDANLFRTLTIIDTDGARITRLIVTVGIPALFTTFNNGDVKGANIQYKIFLSVDGGSNFVEKVNNKIEDKRTDDLYQIQHSIAVPLAANTNIRNLAVKVQKINAIPSGDDIIQTQNSIRFQTVIKEIPFFYNLTNFFDTTKVDTTNNKITVDTLQDFKVNDPVSFKIINITTGGTGTGTLPNPLAVGTDVFVKTYNQANGEMTLSATAGGSVLNITNVGSLFQSNDQFQINQEKIQAENRDAAEDKITYPNSALVGLTLDALQFSSVPQRLYKIKGIKIRIPGAGASGTGTPTVDPITGRIEYSANYQFNNVMQTVQFCSCPVFVLYDILTSRRYGLGDEVLTPQEKVDFSSGRAKNIDLFSFVEASKYANTLVSDNRSTENSQIGTWLQGAGNNNMDKGGSSILITTPTEHGYRNGDRVSIEFTSGVVSSFPDNRGYEVRQIVSTKSFFVEATNPNLITGTNTCNLTRGTTEPRFSFNGVINAQEEVFTLINKISSVFRGAVYWSEGKIKITQDRPSDPVYLFNRSNVTEEGFTYQGSDVKTRTNCVVVKFFSNQLKGIDYVQFPLASQFATDPFIKNYGLNKKQIEAFGCTSAGQAYRLARFIYHTENYLTETINFTTTPEAGVMLKPGMVISVSDPVRSGIRFAGRIAAASSGNNQIRVDDIAGISYSSGDKLSVVLGTGLVEKKDVTGVNTSDKTIDISGTFSSTPLHNSVWMYEKTNAEASTWRIVSIKQEEGLTYVVDAIAYNASLYNTIETGSDVVAKDITTLDEPLKSPTADEINIQESLYKHVPNKNLFDTNNGNVRILLRVGWPAIAGAISYRVLVQVDGGNEEINTVKSNQFEIRDANAGSKYKFSIQTINAGGLLSNNAGIKSKIVDGKSAKPSDMVDVDADYSQSNADNSGVGLIVTVTKNTHGLAVGQKINVNFTSGTANGSSDDNKVQTITAVTTNTFTFTAINNVQTTGTITYSFFSFDIDPVDGVELNWLPILPSAPNFADLDLAGYEIKKGTAWNSGTHPITGATGVGARVSATSYLIPVKYSSASASYMLKAYDTSGNFSQTEAVLAVTISAPSVVQNPTATAQNGNVFVRWEEPATFSFAIDYYLVTYDDHNGDDVSVKVDATQFTLQSIYIGGSATTFTIKAVDITGAVGASATTSITVPEPAAPSNFAFTFSLKGVILSWTKPADVSIFQPPIVGYRVRINGADFVDIESNEVEIEVNKSTFSSLARTFTVVALYQDPAFLAQGKPSSNAATASITVVNPPAVSASAEFIGEDLVLSWSHVAGSHPTIKYAIFDNSDGSLLQEVDSTSAILKADFTQKTFLIKAYSSVYINNRGDSTAEALFVGASATLTVNRNNLNSPSNGSFVLGSEGGLGFVTTSWTAPTVGASNLSLKDYQIIRSTSSTFAGVNTGNTELETFNDTTSFKEEVSWKLAGSSSATSITRYYYIRARDSLDNLGAAHQIEVEIFRPGQVPAEGINEVIDNNVLLRWGEPSISPANQLKISHYVVKKYEITDTTTNPTWANAVAVGGGTSSIVNSRFTVVFETRSGDFHYLIKAVDTAGNESLDSPIYDVELVVSQPPDFVLNANYNSVYSTSNTGLISPQEVESVAFTNCLKIFDQDLNKDVLYMPVLTNSSGVGSETWATHFTNNSKTTLQGFISASHLNYLEPAPTGSSGKGSYQEVFDFGSALNAKINVIAQTEAVGTTTVTPNIFLETSTDASGNSFPSGENTAAFIASRFGSQFRRVRYTTSAQSTSGALVKVKNLNLKLDAKIRNDTGIGYFDHDEPSQANGLTVNFNVAFVDVQGIAVTPNVNGTTAQGIIAVVDFQDVINPTSFKVLLYNTNGDKVSGNFTWQCRGT